MSRPVENVYDDQISGTMVEGGFFQTFRDLERFHFDEGLKRSGESDPDESKITWAIRLAAYRNRMASNICGPQIVKAFAYHAIGSVITPQTLILDDPDYYVSQSNMGFLYCCYKNLFMADIDGENVTMDHVVKTLPHCLCQVEQALEETRRFEETPYNPEQEIPKRELLWKKYKCQNLKRNSRTPDCTFGFRVYKSRNGYHAFCLTHTFDYRSDIAIQLSLECGTDFFYTCFCYLRGWSVRMNRKAGEDPDKPIYSLVGDVCRGEMGFPDDLLIDYDRSLDMDLHDELLELFNDHDSIGY